MSLTLRAPGSDWGHTEGLCGAYDGRPDNDLHSAGGATLEDLHAFISEWRSVYFKMFEQETTIAALDMTHKMCSLY